MHPAERVHHALDLAAGGLSATEIERRTGIPRPTVAGWINHGPPRRSGSRDAPTCSVCGWAAHAYDALPPAYTYLLGLYLGDGCISSHPRGVFRLRIVLDLRYPGII